MAGAFSRMEFAGVVVIDKDKKVIIGQEDWDGKHVNKIVKVGQTKPIHGDWYHNGSGTPHQVVRYFSGVSFSPDGSSLVYCSNQPSIISSDKAFERFVEVQEIPEAQIAGLEEDKRQGRDALREAAQSLFCEAQSPQSFNLYTIDVEGGDSKRVQGSSSAWPSVTVLAGNR